MGAAAVENGQKALETLHAVRPDALLSGLDTPPLDGLTLCRALRALRAYATLPVLVLTAGGLDDARLVEVRRIAGVQLMRKPPTLARIGPALRDMIAAVA